MIRQIHEIRNGRNHGPVTSYVSSSNLKDLNPFVLWDHFKMSNVKGTAGFDFHGHSGVATISYPQIGAIAHKNTGGHSGLLEAGGIQIMSAGSGVLHKETVHPDNKVADAF
ncbi:pirin family protein [Vibrio splendidus]